MSKDLAIVIPAYKKRFFNQTLASISNQTCKDFTLYIGDDASKEDLYSIVKLYEGEIRIVYKRFDTNLGCVSLTKQWERCINLSTTEPYIWLFSDDDEMSSDAVSSFYKEIKINSQFSIYRFNINVVNDINKKILTFNNYPFIQTDMDFFHARITDSIYSCITQYIFTRNIFTLNAGFVEFPYAWSSDDATIILYAEKFGIKKIYGGIINWRLVEGSNITSSSKYEKLRAKAEFLFADWFHNYFRNRLDKEILQYYSSIYIERRLSKLKFKYVLTSGCMNVIFRMLGFASGTRLLLKTLIAKFLV